MIFKQDEGDIAHNYHNCCPSHEFFLFIGKVLHPTAPSFREAVIEAGNEENMNHPQKLTYLYQKFDFIAIIK
jgi:hypothetical protein